MDIGKKLKELRLQNDLTLGDLASRSELTKGFLSQVERGLTTPSIATLEDILEALGSNLSDFLDGDFSETLGLIQLFTGVDDFFFSCIGSLFGSCRHRYDFLSAGVLIYW